jgi:hypothetical protein
MKTQAVSFSELLVTTYNWRPYNPEDCNRHLCRRKNLISHSITCFTLVEKKVYFPSVLITSFSNILYVNTRRHKHTEGGKYIDSLLSLQLNSLCSLWVALSATGISQTVLHFTVTAVGRLEFIGVHLLCCSVFFNVFPPLKFLALGHSKQSACLRSWYSDSVLQHACHSVVVIIHFHWSE